MKFVVYKQYGRRRVDEQLLTREIDNFTTVVFTWQLLLGVYECDVVDELPLTSGGGSGRTGA